MDVTSGGVTDTIASVAGTVANVIAPGSGALVQKIVSKGGAIISGIVDIFRRKKAAGKTDSEAMNDPEFLQAKAAAAAELETLYAASDEYNRRWSQFLGTLSDADKVFISMRKKAKMSGQVLPQAGTLSGDSFSYGGYSLKVSALNAYAPVFSGGSVALDGSVVPAGGGTGGGKDASYIEDEFYSGYQSVKEEQSAKIGIGGIIMSIILMIVALMQWNGGKPTKAEIAKRNRQKAAKKAREEKKALKEKAAKQRKPKRKTTTTKTA